MAGNARRVARWLLVVVALLTLPALGALQALQTPTHVDLAPGLSVEATLRRGATAEVDLGALGVLSLPRAHTALPLLGDVSATIRVDPVTVGDEGQTDVGLYAALLHHPEATLAQPVLSTFRRQALLGAVTGAAADLVLCAGLALGAVLLRRWRDQVEELRAALRLHEEALVGQGRAPLWDEGLARLHRQVTGPWLARAERRSRQMVVGVAVLSVVAGAVVMGLALAPGTTRPRTGNLLGPELTGDNPYLRGATVAGSGAEVLVNQLLTRAIAAKRRVDAAYDRIDRHLQDALLEMSTDADLHDPRYVVLLHISDVHCALPYYERVLPRLVQLTGARVIVDTGDSDVSTGTLPFESQCVNALELALTPRSPDRRVYMVAVMGNHDGSRTAARMRGLRVKGPDRESYRPITVLDDKEHHRASVADVPFVGSSDPRTSVLGTPIQPNGPEEQHAVVDEQGTALADVACDVVQQTGTAPVVLAHDPLAPMAAVRRGCASLALSGHTHRRSALVSYPGPLGGSAVVRTQGTSSGVGRDAFTLYAEPERDASTTVFVWDTLTKQITATFDVVIHPDTTVAVSRLTPVPPPVPLP